MRLKDREEVRRALRERVTRRIAGRGISPRAVDEAVDRVLAALDAGGETERVHTPAPVVAVLTAAVPDLASRTRAFLRDVPGPVQLGTAAAGRHTVVTVRAPEAAREALQRAATAFSASLSFVDAGGPSA